MKSVSELLERVALWINYNILGTYSPTGGETIVGEEPSIADPEKEVKFYTMRENGPKFEITSINKEDNTVTLRSVDDDVNVVTIPDNIFKCYFTEAVMYNQIGIEENE